MQDPCKTARKIQHDDRSKTMSPFDIKTAGDEVRARIETIQGQIGRIDESLEDLAKQTRGTEAERAGLIERMDQWLDFARRLGLIGTTAD